MIQLPPRTEPELKLNLPKQTNKEINPPECIKKKQKKTENLPII